MIRILFTGVGRRVELIQAFRAAAKKLDCPLLIYGVDCSDTAPALEFCDYQRQICRMKDVNYIPGLLRICELDKINLVIPTIDTDLFALAEHKNEFQKKGIRVLVSEKEQIAVCRNKTLTADFFLDCGLESPKPVTDYKEYQGDFPCFIKPKDGSSSMNAFRVDQRRALQVYAEQIYDYMIQPFIEGTEYTVDITCDFDGNPVYIVPRERLAVRSGEVLKTKIALDEKIIGECRKIIEKFHPCGPLTVQLIRQKDTEKDYYIEINPRFGGGAPLSIKAGADSAEATIKLLMGEAVGENPHAVKDGMVYSRFDQGVKFIYRSLIIVGAGGHGKVVLDIARRTDRYAQIAYIDDVKAGYFNGVKILGKLFQAENWIKNSEFVVAVGDNSTREKIQEKLIGLGARMAVLVHPGAIVAEDAGIGEGTVVMAGAVINSGTVIGRGAIINTGCTIDHDNRIEDYAHISPGVHLAGEVRVGKDTWIGIGSVIRNHVEICSQCMIGAGSVVVKDIQDEGIYFGIPARKEHVSV